MPRLSTVYNEEGCTIENLLSTQSTTDTTLTSSAVQIISWHIGHYFVDRLLVQPPKQRKFRTTNVASAGMCPSMDLPDLRLCLLDIPNGSVACPSHRSVPVPRVGSLLACKVVRFLSPTICIEDPNRNITIVGNIAHGIAFPNA